MIHLLYGEYNTIHRYTKPLVYIRPKTALNAHATIFGLPAGTKHVRDPLLRIISHHIISCSPERDRLPRRVRPSGTCKSTAFFVARVIRVRPDDGGHACRRGVPLAVRIICCNNNNIYYYYDTLKPTHHDPLTPPTRRRCPSRYTRAVIIPHVSTRLLYIGVHVVRYICI